VRGEGGTSSKGGRRRGVCTALEGQVAPAPLANFLAPSATREFFVFQEGALSAGRAFLSLFFIHFISFHFISIFFYIIIFDHFGSSLNFNGGTSRGGMAQVMSWPAEGNVGRES